MNCRAALPLSAIWLCGLLVGCGQDDQVTIERRPRPVVVASLTKRPAPRPALLTGSAAAWKTEQLGFEVEGRVAFVVDQNTQIEGRIRDASDNLIVQGTPIARVESERYELGVAKAKAALAQAEQDLVVAQTDLDQTIPAQIEAATAAVKLAQVELERNQRLLEKNAGSQSAVDISQADYDTTMAELKQLIASEKSQQAQITSLESGVLQANKNLRDAQRDLEDCTLYSSFRGQVAETIVVPGSMVAAGSPVVTLQMMDPMMVEVEVSAEQSRQLQRTETLPVHIAMPDGRVEIREGFLHQIDPSADPLTRTFTLTILVLNEQLENRQQFAATTRDIWRLDLSFIPGAQTEDLFVEEGAIRTDQEGSFVWQITNATIQSRAPEDHVFDVRKLRVVPEDLKVPYLGELVFQKVSISDTTFDPRKNLIVGNISVADMDSNAWTGNQILLESPGRWMLRPGDLVRVDLSRSDLENGYYVPMDAVVRRDGNSFLFLVEEDAEASVRQVQVHVVSSAKEPTSGFRRVEPAGEQALEGRSYVTQGAHFLVDGEAVRPVTSEEQGQ